MDKFTSCKSIFNLAIGVHNSEVSWVIVWHIDVNEGIYIKWFYLGFDRDFNIRKLSTHVL